MAVAFLKMWPMDIEVDILAFGLGVVVGLYDLGLYILHGRLFGFVALLGECGSRLCGGQQRPVDLEVGAESCGGEYRVGVFVGGQLHIVDGHIVGDVRVIEGQLGRVGLV